MMSMWYGPDVQQPELRPRIRSLDGLRALAVLAILFSRAAPLQGLHLEALGVELFFVLSGYVHATALLNGEGRRSFFWKRGRRLLPLYGLVLFLVLSGPFVGFPWWSLLTLNVDVAMLFVPTGLWFPGAAIALWIICVDVKALALLPWLLSERRTLRLLIGLSLLSRYVISAECAVHPHDEGIARAVETFFLCRLDGILIGAEAALLVKEGAGAVGMLSTAAVPLVLLRLGLLVVEGAPADPGYALLILPIGVLAATALVVRLASRDTSVPFLQWQPLVRVGTVSTGWYLLHGPIADLVSPASEVRSWGTCAETLLLALLCAGTLWYVFQQPIRRDPSSGEAPQERAGGRRGLRLALALSLSFVLGSQALIVSLSTLTPVPVMADADRSYYERLATAFAHGQTYLLQAPHPDLLTLQDPYDPKQNWMWRLHDAVLYKDRYYLYWGPFPAVLLAPLELLPESVRPRVSDTELNVLFATLLVVACAWLLASLRKLLAPASPAWTVGAGIAVCGLAFPLTRCLARPAIYEGAIIGGQAFLLLGLAFAVRGLGGAVRERFLPLAALSWGAAAATRVSLAPAVAALVVLGCIRLLQLDGLSAVGRLIWRCTLLCVPAGGALLLLLLYNQVRFGSPLEFGMHYMLQGINVHARPAAQTKSLLYLLPNIFCYSLKAIPISNVFPFFQATGMDKQCLAAMNVPAVYEQEACAGLPLYAPILLFAALPFVLWRRGRDAFPAVLRQWLLPGLVAALVLGCIPALFYVGSNMRYLVDMAPVLTVLATVGFWQLLQITAGTGRELRAKRIFVFLAVVTCAIGLLIGLTGPYPRIHGWDQFERDLAQLATKGLG